jgi:hypothetical protein
VQQLWDPSSWSDASGYWLLWSVVGITIVGALVKLAGVRWDDWLDDRLGRGGIRDEWPFNGRRR